MPATLYRSYHPLLYFYQTNKVQLLYFYRSYHPLLYFYQTNLSRLQQEPQMTVVLCVETNSSTTQPWQTKAIGFLKGQGLCGTCSLRRSMQTADVPSVSPANRYSDSQYSLSCHVTPLTVLSDALAKNVSSKGMLHSSQEPAITKNAMLQTKAPHHSCHGNNIRHLCQKSNQPHHHHHHHSDTKESESNVASQVVPPSPSVSSHDAAQSFWGHWGT